MRFYAVIAFVSSICSTEAKETYGLLGSSVSLICAYKVLGDGKLNWRYRSTDSSSYVVYSENRLINNVTITSDIYTRLSITGNHTAGEYHLKITNIKKADAGFYDCKLSTSPDLDTQQFKVIDAPTSVAILSKTPPNRLLGTEGQNLIIECKAIGGDPEPIVTLHIPGLVITPSGTRTVIYTLQNVDRSYDGQTINCIASNNPNTPAQRTDSAQLYLNLKPLPPVFSQDPVRTEENKPLEVSCTSHGSRPAATFVWLLGQNGMDITSFSTLHPATPNVSTDSFTVTSTLMYKLDRTYNQQPITCGVRNIATTILLTTTKVLNVTYAPVVTVHNKTLQPTQTQRTIECNIDGNPAVYTFGKWQHRSKYGELIRLLDGNATLILPKEPSEKQYQDTGEYTCVVSNGISDANGTVQQRGTGYLTNNAPPVYTKDNMGSEIQFGEFEKNIMMFVKVYSVPKYSSTKWYRDGFALTGSKYVTSEELTIVRETFHGVDVQLDGYSVTLTINKLTQQDFANYTLRLYSGNQYVEHMVMLESASAPQSPINFSTTVATYHSVTVTWLPGYDGGHHQRFHIQYRVSGFLEWKLVDIPTGHNEQQSDFMSYTLTGLQNGTTYQLRLYADNKFNSSLPTDIINITTIQTAATYNQLAVGPVIGGVAGGLSLGVLLIIAMVVITRYRGRNLFGRGTCTNFPHFTISCKRDTKDTKDNQRQYDNIGMTSNDSNYEEIETKGKSKQMQESETDAKSYETLGVKEKPNIYDDLKTKGIGQFEEAGREYESFGLNDKTKVYQQIDRRQGKTDNIYENEKF